MPDDARRAKHLRYRLTELAEIVDGENAEDDVEEALPSAFGTWDSSRPDWESAPNEVPSSSGSFARAASVSTCTLSVAATVVRLIVQRRGSLRSPGNDGEDLTSVLKTTPVQEQKRRERATRKREEEGEGERKRLEQECRD